MRVAMVDTSNPDHTGWGFPINAKKAHYFDGGYLSLCGRWMFYGRVTADDGKPSPDDCSPCRKRLSAAIGRKPPTEGAP